MADERVQGLRLSGGGRADGFALGALVLVSFSAVAIFGLTSGALGFEGLEAILTLGMVGGAIVGGVVTVRSGLRLLSPDVDLLLVPRRPRLGEPIELQWDAGGRRGRIESLTFVLYAEQVALDSDGDSGAARKLGRHVLGKATGAEVEGGSLTFDLPRRAKPSGPVGGSQRRRGREHVSWYVQVTGRVSGGVDIDDRYEVDVLAARKRIEND